MTPKQLLLNAIDPALALLEPLGVKSDARARLMLMAIAGQESAWEHRRQIGGPARSFWQFEGGGDVAEVNVPGGQADHKSLPNEWPFDRN